MTTLKYNGSVNSDGILHIRNRKQMIAELKSLSGKEVTIVIEKKKKNRSLEQSKYYWSVVVGLIRERFIELGNQVSKEEVHDYLKHEFNYKEFLNGDEVIRIPKSTANLTTSEFMDYIAKIQTWSAQILECHIPDPNQQLEVFQ